MTLAKGFTQSALFGIFTGLLLGASTFLWLGGQQALQLPLLVTTWWLVIFGCNLLLAYRLSASQTSPFRSLGFQIVHSALAALVYLGINGGDGITDFAATSSQSPEILTAGIAQSAQHFLAQQSIIVPTVFVLSMLSSGLLYAILSKPSAR